MALIANVAFSEESLVRSLKHLLHAQNIEAEKWNSADTAGSLARLLKRGKSPLRSLGLSSGRRSDALHQVVSRQLDMHAPVCNETSYSDDACGIEIGTDQFPILCTQYPEVKMLSFKAGIVDEQIFFFSFAGENCTGLGAGIGFGTDWENNCVSFPNGDEYYRVSCEEDPPALASKNLGTCDIRQYGDSQCSGSFNSTTVPSGCAKIEEEGLVAYVKIQEVDGNVALIVYDNEGCTGASTALMLGQADSLSKCAPFGDVDEYIQIQCRGGDSAASTLLTSSVLYYLAAGMAWLLICVV